MTAVEVEDVRTCIVNECLLEAMPSRQYSPDWRTHGFTHPMLLDLMENTILEPKDPDLLPHFALISMSTSMAVNMTTMIGTPMNAVTDVVTHMMPNTRSNTTIGIDSVERGEQEKWCG
jgi:hypothetical protein